MRTNIVLDDKFVKEAMRLANVRTMREAIAVALLDSETSGGLELLELPALSRAYLSVSAAEINRVAKQYYRPERLQIEVTGAVPRRAEPRIFPDGTFRSLFEP